MAQVFQTKELDARNHVVNSVYKADSKTEVEKMIRAKGHRPIRIQNEGEKGTELSNLTIFSQKVKSKDLAVFCKQLFTMLYAGMPLISALEVLYSQAENKTLQQAVKAMVLQVQKGDILSVAMKAHPKIFPTLLISMVESGELTGNLDGVLERMAEHYTKENRIQSKVKSAMVYPSVLAVLAVSVVTFLIVFIMPTFVGMFESSGVPLPGPTRFLLGISNGIRDYWYLVIAVISVLAIIISRVVKSKEGKRAFDKLKLSLPGIKGPISKIATSRFTRTLSTLLGSGIPIIQALDAAAIVTGNAIVIEGLAQVSEDIKKGDRLSLLLKKVGVFPPMVISMVSIGEESGAMEEMLEKTADYFDEELDAAIQKLITLIEPVMLLSMAVVIGFIVISMMLPMFDMFQTIG